MSTSTDDFFEEALEQSRIKARIVSDYVISFGRILSDYQRSVRRDPTVDYVDLFSGPGSYADGTASTPLRVIRAAVNDPKLAPALRTYFNDMDQENAGNLEYEIGLLPGLEQLKYRPQVFNEEANVEFVDALQLDPRTPRLFFLDPFGYKAISLPLLRRVLSGWSECIFFFNYRRVRAALNNEVLEENLRRLFGTPRLNALKSEVEATSGATQAEAVVLNHLDSTLLEIGARYVLKFSFKVNDAHRSTHHLIFATRHKRGYEVMKSIMAGQSTRTTENGPSMTFTQQPISLSLFERRPEEVLAEKLLDRFAGRQLTFGAIYNEHGVETLYTEPIFRRALLLLEANNQIDAIPKAAERPCPGGNLTMSSSTVLRFPRKA